MEIKKISLGITIIVIITSVLNHYQHKAKKQEYHNLYICENV